MTSRRRFMTLPDVADELNTSMSQVYALVRSGNLPAIKVGGRGQWRVEMSVLEAWIGEQYDNTRGWIADHPYTESGGDAEPGEPDTGSPEEGAT